MTTSKTLPLFQMMAVLAPMLLPDTAVAQAAKLDPPVKPVIEGKFIGNGKPSALKYVWVEPEERFNDRDAVGLVFTEKNPAGLKQPRFDALFGKLGSALLLKVHHDGGIFGCQVVHSAHEKQGFTALGQIKTVGFEIVGGNVKGQVITPGLQDAFGEKWEVDLKFAAALPEKLRNAPPAAAKPAATEPQETAKAMPKAPTGPLIDARKLTLPKDATDVQYKKRGGLILCSSARPVDVVAKEISASLKQQGWKDGPGNLMGKTNAILKREQGEAKLTIMVQPAGVGSVVKIFTEGMDWTAVEEGTPPAPEKTPSADDLEKQADKILKDALKLIPKGL